MKRYTSTIGMMGAILGLGVACNGRLQNLGDDNTLDGQGGAADQHSSTTGGVLLNRGGSSNPDAILSIPAGGSINVAQTSGSPLLQTGGAPPSSSQTSGTPLLQTGGAPPSQTGGAFGSGGTPVVVVSNESAGVAGRAFGGAGGWSGPAQWSRSDMAGPIDPTCTCPSPNDVCDVTRRCVNECNDQGLCANWLTNRAVRSLYHDGRELYYATARSTDAEGKPNPTPDGSLYRRFSVMIAETQIATGLPDPANIIGRYGSSTYLTVNAEPGYALYEVTDTGVVMKLSDSSAPNASMQGKWLAFLSGTNPRKLMTIDLDAGRTPVEVVSTTDAGPGPITDLIVVGHRVVYRIGSSDGCFVALPPTIAGSPTCGIGAFTAPNHNFLTADTSQLFFGGGEASYVGGYDPDGTLKLVAYDDPQKAPLGTTILAGGSLYSTVQPSQPSLTSIVRYAPATGASPHTIVPAGFGSHLFAVGATDIFWTYPQSNTNSAQYVFYRVHVML